MSHNPNPEQNYVGRVFGHLTVLAHQGRDPLAHRVVLCRCECGVELQRRVDVILRSQRASCGCKRPWLAGNRNHRGKVKAGLEASEHPTVKDIAWAAGVYEGEGSVCGTWYTKKNGSRLFMIQATVPQVDFWLPERLRQLFGGTIRTIRRKEPRLGFKNSQDYYTWNASGSRARGFLMTIYTLLSPRRQAQIRSKMDWLQENQCGIA